MKAGVVAAAALAAAGARADTYLQELQASAREQRLAEAAGWLKLLHYERGLFGGWHSEASRPQISSGPTVSVRLVFSATASMN